MPTGAGAGGDGGVSAGIVIGGSQYSGETEDNEFSHGERGDGGDGGEREDGDTAPDGEDGDTRDIFHIDDN